MRREPVFLALGVCLVVTWYLTRVDSQPAPKSPADCPCGLEPGGGPMRCANPCDANSFSGLQRSLFALQHDWPCKLHTWAVLMSKQQIDPGQVPDRRYGIS